MIIETVLDGYADRLDHEREARSWLAYHTGLLAQVTSFPSYDDFVGRPREPQSDDDMAFNLTAWAAATQTGE